MKIILKLSILTIILMLVPFVVLIAQNNAGLQFLTIGPNAHSLALSEAHTAVPLGSTSLFTNPANLMLSEQSNLSASYTLWIGDTQNTQASAAIRGKNHTYAIGILSSLVDDITVRNQPGPPEGNFSVRYVAVSGAYARQIGFLSLGASLSYLYEQFFQLSASGYGFSAGMTGSFLDNRLRAAMSVNNLGQMQKLNVERSELPTQFRTGIDVNAVQLSAFSGAEIPVVINLSADYVLPLNEKNLNAQNNLIESGEYLAFGLDAGLYDIVNVRAGYRTGDTARKWSFGAAIQVDPVKVHYAFIPFETGFGMVHSISMQYFFDF
jgi:hypothetical protein